MKLKINHSCPQCSKTMKVSVLHCHDCDVDLKAHFEDNPLLNLNAEMMHFLNVFILSEGKIGDMEKALGISYPTVKNKLQQLKTLVAGNHVETNQSSKKVSFENSSIMEILESIDSGELDYETGHELIKRKKAGKK
jgi:hypothetical protein